MPRLRVYWTTAVSTTCPTFPNLPVDGPSFTVQLWSDTVTTTSSSIYGTSVDFIFDQLQFVDVVGLFYIYILQKVIRL
jgi:hypothetical protein